MRYVPFGKTLMQVMKVKTKSLAIAFNLFASRICVDMKTGKENNFIANVSMACKTNIFF